MFPTFSSIYISNQSGFDINEKRDRERFVYVRFSKVGWMKILDDQSIPNHAITKEATFRGVAYSSEIGPLYFDLIDSPSLHCQ